MDLSRDPHRGLIDELDIVHDKSNPQKFINDNQGSFLDRRRHETATAEALINDENSPDRFARLVKESIPMSSDQNSLRPDPTIIASGSNNNENNLHERNLAPSWILILLVAPLIVVLLVWLLILLRRRFEQTQHIHLVNQNKINNNNSYVGVNQQAKSGQVFQHSPSHNHKAVFASQSHLYMQHNSKSDKNTKLSTTTTANCKSRSSKASNHHHHKTHNAHYLLESSSSGTSTSSTSSTSTNGGGSPAASPSDFNLGQPTTTTATLNTPISSPGEQLRLNHKNSSDLLSLDPLRSLLDHMHLYLLTLTYQEIIACMVAFTIAILNIVRMRNLFCCNLIIFILITSKLFNLLTLTTFSLTKLIKLFNLKIYDSNGCSISSDKNKINDVNHDTNNKDNSQNSKDSNSHYHRHHDRQQDNQERITFHTDDKKSEDSLIDRNTSSSFSSSTSTSSTATTTAPAAATAIKNQNKPTDEPQIVCSNNSGDRSIFKSKQHQQRPRLHSTAGQNQPQRSSSPYDTNATICRLIVKDNKSKRGIDDMSTEISEESFCFSQQDISCSGQNMSKAGYIDGLMSSNRLGSSNVKSLKNNYTIGEPIACRLLLIAVISLTIGLVCLYLRLMPLTGPLLLNLPDNLNRNSSSGQDWSISIYVPSTTTEASTRYSSLATDESKTSSMNNNNQNSQQQQPNYQATWSARFQQSSQLKHLIDQYELQNFINLLLDTHLQTSRFMCTLAANNYAPFAKQSMMTLYASLMLLIFIMSIVIQQVGRRKLRQFDLAYLGRGLGTMSATNVLLANYPSWLNHGNRHNYITSDDYLPTHAVAAEFPMSLYGNASQQKATDSNRKRYSDLLKQNIAKQQQSSLDIYSSAALRRLHQRQQSRKIKLRNSSSLSSLLVTPTMIAGGHLDAMANGDSTGAASFSASVDRYPVAQLQSGNKPYKYQYQQQQQQQAVSRRTHLRRLISAQSMCNLAPSSAQQAQQQQQQGVVNTKIPAGKFASSGGQLAWLPLGSAATVASLSNIGRENPPTSTMEESEEDSWSRQLIAKRLKLTDNSNNSDRQRVGIRRTTGGRERLGSIGEHLVDCTSTLDEHGKKETAIESDLCGKNLNRLNGKNGMRGRMPKKTTPNIETTATVNIADTTATSNTAMKLNELSSSPSTSSSALVSGHQQQQQQQLKQRTGSWPLYSNQHESHQQNQYQCQQIDQRDGFKNRLNYAELKRDLRLSQSVILFGQLLNHAPILVSIRVLDTKLSSFFPFYLCTTCSHLLFVVLLSYTTEVIRSFSYNQPYQ